MPYTPFREDMTPNEPKPHAKTFEVHQSLTSMPAYQNISPEELRLMDYNQGRGKGVTGPTPSVGAPSFGFGAQQGMGTSTPAFGQQPQQPATTNVFGQPPSTGMFGQPSNNAMGTTSMFGGASNTSTSTGGLFGANANKPSAFGASTSTPMFGQANQNNNTSGGLFGNSTPAQPAAGGFTFGANNNQQQPSTGFSFGANNTQAHEPLQRILLPKRGEPFDVRMLYLIEAEQNRERLSWFNRTSVTIPAGEEASFETYFNAFPASYWRRWSQLDEVKLRITTEAQMADTATPAGDAASTGQSEAPETPAAAQ